MSNEENTEGDASLDLSGLNFGPAWARSPSESKSVKKFKDRGDRSESRDRRGDNGDRRGGGRGRGGGDRRGGGGRGRDDRRGGGRGGNFRGGRGGRGGRDDRRPQREEVAAPEGFKIRFMPSEESLDLLAKEVTQTGRTFSVFDLAKVLLQGRDRFRVTFEHPEQKVFRCSEDNSVWLTKTEALRQLWRGDWLKKFYDEVQVEGEAPSGSFQSVARCGISGKYLGPPNYHAYQQNIISLHREQFASMPLERFKSKIVMERGEEAVAAWLESMKITTQWKVSSSEITEAEEAPKEEAPETKSEETEATAEETPAVEETTSENAAAEENSEVVTEEVSEPASKKPTPEAEAETSEEAPSQPEAETEELFKTTQEVEQHFLANYFDKVFEETNRAWVMGDIQGKFLSPGLLTLLKNSVIEEKRYPANLMPIVCRQLSGRHVAVFKWQKKLKVGPSRPHAIPADMKIAERPQAIVDYLQKNSGKKLEELWKTTFTEDSTDEQKAEWYHDLHWLLNQGHAVLLSDTTLHLSKSGDQNAPAKKAGKKKAIKKVASKKEQPESEDAPASEADAPTPDPVAEAAPEKAEPTTEVETEKPAESSDKPE